MMSLLPLFLDAPPVHQGTRAALCAFASSQDWSEGWCAWFVAQGLSEGWCALIVAQGYFAGW